MDRPGKDRRPQRRMSFNYKWDVQEQSASISFSSFGLTLTKRPLDLLDESFERSDQSAPVSLIQLSQGPIFARRESAQSSDDKKVNFSLCEWFCPKLSRAPTFKQPAIEGSSGYVNSSTVRLTSNGRFDPLLLEECDDQQYWQRQRRFPHRRPLPNLPAAQSTLDDEEEYFHSLHLSLVVITIRSCWITSMEL